MGDENVELLWYVFCLIKAVIVLFALLCKWLLRTDRHNGETDEPV
jgi:hypothetical protein